MGFKLLGYEFRKVENEDTLQTFAAPVADDGAVVVSATNYGAGIVDTAGALKTDYELITKYRAMAGQPEIDSAIKDIVNEAIVKNDDEETVVIDLDDTKLQDSVKQIIFQEFDEVMRLLQFHNQGYDIFERFYVDGRLYFHAIIDKKFPQLGIQKLQYLDPRKIRKVRETKQKDQRDSNIPNSEEIERTRKEYYIYNERGFGMVGGAASATGWQTNTTGLKIAKDAIVHITSGIVDEMTATKVQSHLHKAIKPLNQLRALEDSALIYRISRAPERRVFYVDTGGMPRQRAEQHVREMMVKFKNKLIYDQTTGEIKDARKQMHMLEDIWLARPSGGTGTQIDVLKSGEITGVMDEVEFFQMKLFKALNVPFSRFSSDGSFFSFGRSAEISRDEVNFATFIDRMRLRFNSLFLKIMERQLILKGILGVEDWAQIEPFVKFKYAKNNLFSEMKNAEIQTDRLNRLTIVDQFVGRYFSHKWVRKNVLCQTDKEMAEIDAEIEEEMKMMQFNPARMLAAPGQPQLGPPDEQQAQPAPAQQPQNEDVSAINLFQLQQQMDNAARLKKSRETKKINKKVTRNRA